MLKCVSTEWEMEAYIKKPTERHCGLSSHIKLKDNELLIVQNLQTGKHKQEDVLRHPQS